MRLSRQVGPLESTPSIDDIFEPNRSLVNGLMLAEKLSRLKSINDHFVRKDDISRFLWLMSAQSNIADNEINFWMLILD